MLNVIIPAYNEARTIGKVIAPYHAFASTGHVKVFVVCNGCTDLTEVEAKKFDFVTVISLREGSKIKAINHAVRDIKSGHVLVQDADVIVGVESISRIVDFCKQDGWDLAATEVNFNKSRSFWVRKYYKALESSPAFMKGMVSCGNYLVNSRLLDYIFPLPNVIADDGYVKFKMADKIFKKIDGAVAIVSQPNNFLSLLKIKTRSRLGNKQLGELFKKGSSSYKNKASSLMKGIVKDAGWLPFFLYMTVVFISAIRSKMQASNPPEWERDESTR
jgi:glycosyltransferase involved in cell wall biosynthesis